MDYEAKSEQIRRASEARKRSLAGKEDLVAEVSALLFRHDPIGLDFGVNDDEYQPEAETILLRLLANEPDWPTDLVVDVVHEEFVSWFGAGEAGSRDRYQTIGAELRTLLDESTRPSS